MIHLLRGSRCKLLSLPWGCILHSLKQVEAPIESVDVPVDVTRGSVRGSFQWKLPWECQRSASVDASLKAGAEMFSLPLALNDY